MSRFTEQNLIKSNTATRLGINNHIAPEHKKNIPRILDLLDRIEAALGCKVTLTSCYRSGPLNAAVGGSKTSAHCKLLAVDVEPEGMSNMDACKILAVKLSDYDQIIYEFGAAGWVHVGLSDGLCRRQNLTAVKVAGKTVYKTGFVPA